MNLITLAALLVSIACIASIDARYRLFVWRAPMRAGRGGRRVRGCAQWHLAGSTGLTS